MSRMTAAKAITSRLACLLACVLVAFAGVDSARAQEGAPACTGQDLVPAFKRDFADQYAAIVAESEKVENAEGLFWKIEKAGVPPSHLFGTVHLTDPRVVEPPAVVEAARARADVVALEVPQVSREEIAAAMASLSDRMMITDGRPISKLLPAETVERLWKLLAARGIPVLGSDYLKPWVLFISLALPACETARQAAGLNPLDAVIGLAARRDGQRLVGLETVAEQISAIESFSHDLQLRLITDVIAFADRLDDFQETMIGLYRQERVAVILPLWTHWTNTDISDPVFAEFMRILIEKRNLVMRDRALPLLETGNAFIAVGALHLPFKTGLVELFREAGYTVTRVPLGQ